MSDYNALVKNAAVSVTLVLQKKIKDLPVAQDLTRLAKKVVVLGENGERAVYCDASTTDMYIWIHSLLCCMQAEIHDASDSPESSSFSLEEFKSEVNLNYIASLSGFLTHKFGDLGKVSCILKATTQSGLMSVTNEFRRQLMGKKINFKDGKGWEIIVHINNKPSPTVTHKRREQIFELKGNGPLILCEFGWEIEIVFASKYDFSKASHVNITLSEDITFTSAASAEQQQHITRELKKLFHSITIDTGSIAPSHLDPSSMDNNYSVKKASYQSDESPCSTTSSQDFQSAESTSKSSFFDIFCCAGGCGVGNEKTRSDYQKLQ